jgi:DNA repair exonuclease SbcCD ATPase subunit
MIVPPLDKIPKLPGKAAGLVQKQIDTQTDVLLDQVKKTIQNSVNLPINTRCDDPKIKQIKDQLQEIQKQITKVQETIPKIQSTIETTKTIITVAQGIKSAISAAQLSNPVTAPLFIAQQLTEIQNATIVNAAAALKQFETIPTSLTSKLETIIPPLLGALKKVSDACNGDVDNLEIPTMAGSGSNINYNDLVPTEFYTNLNVSESDLQERSDSIELVLQQQRDLLSSLQEAPSKVYQDNGIPAADLGKTGDYYIDLTTSIVYGPKVSPTQWGTPVN